MQQPVQGVGAQVFCRNCGKQTDGDGLYCKHCGFSVGKVSYTKAWWLLPIFLGILGGLIAYAGVRRMNKGSARLMLILSIVLWVLIVVLVGAAYYFIATTTP
jgi:uncharacterized membrane protein YvbJ